MGLRRIGLSRAKVAYLRDLAERLVDGQLDLDRLRNLDYDDARTELMQVEGVRRFTADPAHRPQQPKPRCGKALTAQERNHKYSLVNRCNGLVHRLHEVAVSRNGTGTERHAGRRSPWTTC